MCWQCSPMTAGEDGRTIDKAIEGSARSLFSTDPVTRRRLLQAALGLLALPGAQALQACATVPVTGRSQLRLISEQEEAKVGVAAFQQLREEEVKNGRLLTEREDPAAHAWVKRVSDRIIGASGLGNTYTWQYMSINAPNTINAAAIAGGASSCTPESCRWPTTQVWPRSLGTRPGTS